MRLGWGSAAPTGYCTGGVGGQTDAPQACAPGPPGGLGLGGQGKPCPSTHWEAMICRDSNRLPPTPFLHESRQLGSPRLFPRSTQPL